MDLKEELGNDQEHLQEQIDLYKNNILSINELLDALKRLKKIPAESKLTRIFEVLDEDKDGNIDINLALKVLELLSKEHLKLSESQVKEVTKLLKHEALLAEEERKRELEEKMLREQEQKMQEEKRIEEKQ